MRTQFIVTAAAMTAVGWGSAANAAGPGEAQREGRAIYHAYIDAVGGAGAIARVGSFTVEGTYELPSFGLSGTIALAYERPDRLRFTVDIPGFGVAEQGLAGGVAWRVHPQAGAAVMEGRARAVVLKQAARGFSLLPDIGMYATIESLGEGEFEGAPAHHLRLTTHDGQTIEEFFDPDTHLLIGRIESQPAPGGEDATLIGRASAYREIEGVRFATVWSHSAQGQDWTATYTSIEVNPEIPPTRFEPPAQVRALLDAEVPAR